MEVKLEVDATGRKEGKAVSHPFPFAAVPKVKVGEKSGQARISALKVGL